MIKFNIIKQLLTFILALLLSIALGSCVIKGACQTGKSSQASMPLLQFQKTPCYGTCPAYEANIMENGSITFIPWDNISEANNDTIQLCFNEQELQQLKSDIKDLNYTLLQNAYLTEWTDRPSTYLTFYQNGKTIKRVKHQEGGPEALIKFQKNLHRQLLDLVAMQTKKK